MTIIRIVVLTAAVLPNVAAAAVIQFDPKGAFREDFGPPNGAGALEYRRTSTLGKDPDGTNIVIVPQGGVVPDTVSGRTLNTSGSPIRTHNGNPGTARVVTDLAVGHGDGLGNLESNGSIIRPTRFDAPAGSLSESFSASGIWRLGLSRRESLDFVGLTGNLKGDVSLQSPFFGDARAIVSGTIRIDPFGSFPIRAGTKLKVERSGSVSLIRLA